MQATEKTVYTVTEVLDDDIISHGVRTSWIDAQQLLEDAYNGYIKDTEANSPSTVVKKDAICDTDNGYAEVHRVNAAGNLLPVARFHIAETSITKEQALAIAKLFE